MRVFIFLLAILTISCKEQQNSVSGKRSLIKTEFKKQFNQRDHLFLNYYFGMSVQDYENATKFNFTQKKILLADDDNDCRLGGITETNTLEDIEEINRLSKIYYVFGSGQDEFEAVIKPVFRNDKLVKIELQTLNCFTVGDHKHGFYRKKVNEIHDILLKLHLEDYGKYTSTPKQLSQHEIMAYENAGIPMDSFDSNRYTFTDNGKIISIEQKCCDFKPIIIYAVDDARLAEIH